jgi:hypothetical protein
MTENPLPGAALTQKMTLRLMPRLLPVLGGLVLAASMGLGIAAAPREFKILTAVVELVIAFGLGAMFVHFLRLRCRIELPWPYRTLNWSTRRSGEDRRHVEIESIAGITTPVDETSDEPAHYVAFELKDGRRVLLSNYSWEKGHAEKLAEQLCRFLDRAARASADLGPPTSS